jgi:AcrR family transcriptional regulator
MASTTIETVRDGRVRKGLRTRQRVLDAAIVCLVRDGYAGTTTVRIAEVAGVSRGALLHQFQTREELVAAAVEHLALRRTAELAGREGELPAGRARVGAALDLMWEVTSGDLYGATLELWTASRTDPALQVRVDAVERRLGREVRELAGRLLGGEIAARAGFFDRVQFALGVMRGISLLEGFHPDAKARARQWAFARGQLVAMFTNDTEGTDR